MKAVGRNGFTLLELLISIVLLGLIVGIMASGMRLGFRAVESGEKRIDTLERLRTSVQVIDAQIQSQLPLTYEEDAEKKFYFEGSGESMQFTSNYSLWGGEKGYVVVNYAVEQEDNGKQGLKVSENVVGTDASRETTLFSGLDSIGFEYYYEDPTEEKGEWVEDWTDSLSIPSKVRLSIDRGGDKLSLIIPVRAGGKPASEAQAVPPAEEQQQ
jgi:general secretion pathway protein J